MITEKCSLYKPFFSKRTEAWEPGLKPETVNLIDYLLIPWQSELMAEIKNESNKDERAVLKKKLWALTPSSIQAEGRGIQYVVEHSGLLQFDIDPKENPILKEPEGLEKMKSLLVNIPYTVYCGLSSSGTGYWGLFRITHPHLHSQHFDAMEKSFMQLGVKVDQAPKSTASLRFISYDPDAYFNDNAELFDLRVEPVKVEKKPLHLDGNNTDQSDSKILVKRFNEECSSEHIHEILINFGFNYHSRKGKSYRFTRPGKATKAGLSVDYHEDKRTLFCFSSEVPGLEHWKQDKAGWSCSPTTALLLYGCGGKEKEHWKMAFNYIKSKL